jgi:hypothetical protein
MRRAVYPLYEEVMHTCAVDCARNSVSLRPYVHAYR